MKLSKYCIELTRNFTHVILLLLLSFSLYATSRIDSSNSLTKDHTAVGTGPYFGLGTTYKGESLVVLQPNIHKDLALLKENQKMRKKLSPYSDGPKNPFVQISGLSEVQAIFETQARNDITLAAAFLDLDAWINPWLTAFTSFGVEIDEMQQNNFRMLQAFITLGNLEKFPVYATIGQMYIPFGSFSTGTSDMGTLTRSVGRIYDRAFSVGFFPGNGLHIAGAIYKGQTRNSPSDNVDQFAGTASYTGKVNLIGMNSNIKTGVSYTNNILEASATRNMFIPGAALSHYVPGFDVFTNISIGPFIIRGEYVSALKQVSANDVLQSGNRVKPRSYLTEIEYDTNLFGKSTWVTLHFSEGEEAALSTKIQHQTGVNIGMHVLKNTILSLEYSHRKSYSTSNTISNITMSNSAGAMSNTLNTTNVLAYNGTLNGRERNVLIGTLDLFF